MAQHYLIREKDEPAVFKSIRQITKSLVRILVWSQLKDFEIIMICTKQVQKLPATIYNPGGFAFTVHPCTLKNKEWDQRDAGGADFRKNAFLEVHTDLKGKVKKVYYPL